MSITETYEGLARYEPPPIEVTIKLKREQRDKHGDLYMTFKGEKMKVTGYYIKFQATTLQEAVQSFYQEECEAFIIHHNRQLLSSF